MEHVPPLGRVAPPQTRRRRDLVHIVQDAFTFETLVRRKKLIIQFLIAGFLLAALYTLLRPTLYVATSSVLLEAGSAGDSNRFVLMANGDQQRLASRLLELRARRARLLDELDGKPEKEGRLIQVRASAGETGESKELDQIIDQERSLMTARTTSLNQTLETLNHMLELNKSEVESLVQQVEYAKQQQQSIDDELAGVRTLVDKGLSPMTRQRDLERTGAALASRKAEIESKLLSQKQAIFETMQKMDDEKNRRRTEILNELQTVESSARETETNITTAALISAMTGNATDPVALENGVEIVRSDSLARAIADNLNLRRNDRFLRANSPSVLEFGKPVDLARIDDAKRKALAALVVQKDITAERMGRGSRLDISFVSVDPELASQVANEAARIMTQPVGDTQAPARMLRAAAVNTYGPSASAIFLGAIILSLFMGSSLAFGLEVLHRSLVTR